MPVNGLFLLSETIYYCN